MWFPMGIKYPVGVGTILLYNYDRGGFQPPEMVKRRPAIVISPRLPYRNGLCTVVAISSESNERGTSYVIRLAFNFQTTSDPPRFDHFHNVPHFPKTLGNVGSRCWRDFEHLMDANKIVEHA